MSHKDIEFNSHKAESHDEKKIRSSQHSKINKSMADQLRGEIDTLIENQDKAEAETWKSHARFEKFKAQEMRMRLTFIGGHIKSGHSSCADWVRRFKLS
jgi:flagellar hook-basal body complex protein FliE